jgi:hypothetical protein
MLVIGKKEFKKLLVRVINDTNNCIEYGVDADSGASPCA